MALNLKTMKKAFDDALLKTVDISVNNQRRLLVPTLVWPVPAGPLLDIGAPGLAYVSYIETLIAVERTERYSAVPWVTYCPVLIWARIAILYNHVGAI